MSKDIFWIVIQYGKCIGLIKRRENLKQYPELPMFDCWCPDTWIYKVSGNFLKEKIDSIILKYKVTIKNCYDKNFNWI